MCDTLNWCLSKRRTIPHDHIRHSRTLETRDAEEKHASASPVKTDAAHLMLALHVCVSVCMSQSIQHLDRELDDFQKFERRLGLVGYARHDNYGITTGGRWSQSGAYSTAGLHRRPAPPLVPVKW